MLFPVLALLLVVFLEYGIVGVTFFSDKFASVLQGEAPRGNFNSLSRSLLTLFQMFIGESWEQIMYAGINVTSWSAAYFFLSFIFIVTLLFGNLFKALFLNIHRVGAWRP